MRTLLIIWMTLSLVCAVFCALWGVGALMVLIEQNSPFRWSMVLWTATWLWLSYTNCSTFFNVFKIFTELKKEKTD